MTEMLSNVGYVSLLDYGAGNVRSLRNAIKALGFDIRDITCAEEIYNADVIIFPGVGSFGQAMQSLINKGWIDALRSHILQDKPFFGICIGMQSLFEGSDESPVEHGLAIIPGRITKFSTENSVRVPQIGWNGIRQIRPSIVLENIETSSMVYFVHSFCALPSEANSEWISAVTDYGNQRYISMIQKGNVIATQFHPEKSGQTGLKIIASFLLRNGKISPVFHPDSTLVDSTSMVKLSEVLDYSRYPQTCMSKRVIACLDVRSNDDGDLVVTKGDQYDVREASHDSSGKGNVRNLGKPVGLCKRYYDDGADEIVFLNITSFRQGVIEDMPMLAVLEQSSESVFVPLTVGGGIRDYEDCNGKIWSALDVAARYFRAGADKVSIGGDAVYAAEEYMKTNELTGNTSIEMISRHYGAQAVVVSIDPKRVYMDGDAVPGKTVCQLREGEFGPNGETRCWWQATVKGGREARDVCAVSLAKACQALGAGEIMLNCIDMDGQGKGYDIPLLNAVQSAVSIPVIASSGAGSVEHFSEVFRETGVLAALAAGIFHRNEVRIEDVKNHLAQCGIQPRV